jgi:hypothetical protein
MLQNVCAWLSRCWHWSRDEAQSLGCIVQTCRRCGSTRRIRFAEPIGGWDGGVETVLSDWSRPRP